MNTVQQSRPDGGHCRCCVSSCLPTGTCAHTIESLRLRLSAVCCLDRQFGHAPTHLAQVVRSGGPVPCQLSWAHGRGVPVQVRSWKRPHDMLGAAPQAWVGVVRTPGSDEPAVSCQQVLPVGRRQSLALGGVQVRLKPARLLACVFAYRQWAHSVNQTYGQMLMGQDW
jgi:hypothetical protein